MTKKYVFLFDEGNQNMKDILGGKGANLAEMTNLGLPIPSGFTISTEACKEYYLNNQTISDEIRKEIFENLSKLEELTGKKFGDINNPLLVSIRSGAPVSMPGMMDTILNLGLNDDTLKAIINLTNNPRFAYDSYRRFIAMYSDVVKGISPDYFEAIIAEVKKNKNIKYDNELTVDDLKIITNAFKKIYKMNMKQEFPNDPKVQLITAIEAVFKSWNNKRAIVYRRMNNIPSTIGTAVNIQQMVFGNMGVDCGTGVAFTRNPSTGEKGMFGEYLINAQGEDVVAGIRTPSEINTLKDIMPEIYDEFTTLACKLENHYRDMQDMEFTIENRKLYFLQTRNGKRTARAAIKISCDMVDEKLIDEKEALMRIDADSLDQLLHPTFNLEELKSKKAIAKGLPSSPGAGAGEIVFNALDAKKLGKGGLGKRVILVRLETTPEDIEGMTAASGILTVRGGMTSHAAVVARGMGVCCISGCGDINIDVDKKQFIVGNLIFKEGDFISLDGNTGNVYSGDIKLEEASVTGDFKRIMDWALQYKKLNVRANADNPRDTKKAIELGADGIGLCRTEHMFFDEERIARMREMILATNEEERKIALDKLIPFQKQDFKDMYKQLKGLPMTVRYLDPPLHEFLPKTDDEIRNLAEMMNVSFEKLKNKCIELHEFNPMMGHRGCRLDVTYPSIAKMQTRALIEALIESNEELNVNNKAEIMIPLVGDIKELKFVKDIVEGEINKIKKETSKNFQYQIGTMIEVPRAALLADEIAKEAEFFSFGTNDLTQLTFGFSRDDASKFLDSYYENQIYESDPFKTIDKKGVLELVRIGAIRGRSTNPNLELGICGEHGGDKKSIELFNEVGLDYVSCSPYRVPISILASAQAAIKSDGQK